MLSRKEIKSNACNRFKANYWPVVGITLLFALIISGASATFVGMFIMPHVACAAAAYSLGVYRCDGTDSLGDSFSKGFDKFGRKLGSTFLAGLYLFLWSLLFIIPGIIKTFSYAMTSYILADCPEVKAVDAITLSRKMMDGHKWELFVFQLSFIGWFILSSFTFGILAIFYVAPYYEVAMAGYYDELKNDCLAKGVVTQAMLDGVEGI